MTIPPTDLKTNEGMDVSFVDKLEFLLTNWRTQHLACLTLYQMDFWMEIHSVLY